jgi:hypothetical protein
MTPVLQRNATDCYRACLASILDYTLETVPDFSAGHSYASAQDWVAQEGLVLIFVTAPAFVRLTEFVQITCPDVHYILWGVTRKGVLHSVIGRNGEIVHDPAPVPQGELLPIEGGYHLNLIGKKV